MNDFVSALEERVLVCDGAMRLSQAQRIIASNWIAAYRQYG